MPTRKVYVIGAGIDSTEIERAKAIIGRKDIEVICVNSKDDLPKDDALAYDILVVSQMHKYQAHPPIPELKVVTYEPEPKRKGHERPYKYHR